MQSYENTCGILSRPRNFVPGAGGLTVHNGWGLDGRRVPILLAACSYEP